VKFADLQHLPDAELVELTLGGEGAAFNAIMKRYNQRLFRAARAIVRDDSEAEDVLQEAYMRAYRGLSKFRREASLATWLTRITLNEALGTVRRRRPAEPFTTLDEIDNQSEDRTILFPLVRAAGDPEASAARADVRRVLEHAIDELPEAFRLVFVLREIEQLSVDETAGHLGIPPETVKTRLHRARRLLRKALGDTFSSVVTEAFPYQGAPCAQLRQAVLRRIGFALPYRLTACSDAPGLTPAPTTQTPLPQAQERPAVSWTTRRIMSGSI
jgi:RNA polymerase sigma-70 factor, ECF subfamily